MFFSDSQYLLKTELFPNVPFVNCSQSSCLNGGSCVETGGNENICVCLPHFTGEFYKSKARFAFYQIICQLSYP